MMSRLQAHEGYPSLTAHGAQGTMSPSCPELRTSWVPDTGPKVAKLATDARQHLILFVNTQIAVVSVASQRVSSGFVFGLLYLTSLHTQFPFPDLDHIRVIFIVENIPSTDSRALPQLAAFGMFPISLLANACRKHLSYFCRVDFQSHNHWVIYNHTSDENASSCHWPTIHPWPFQGPSLKSRQLLGPNL